MLLCLRRGGCAVSLESSIVGDGSSAGSDDNVAPHFNALVKMIHLAEKAPTATDADAIAVAISAVQGAHTHTAVERTQRLDRRAQPLYVFRLPCSLL